MQNIEKLKAAGFCIHPAENAVQCVEISHAHPFWFSNPRFHTSLQEIMETVQPAKPLAKGGYGFTTPEMAVEGENLAFNLLTEQAVERLKELLIHRFGVKNAARLYESHSQQLMDLAMEDCNFAASFAQAPRRANESDYVQKTPFVVVSVDMSWDSLTVKAYDGNHYLTKDSRNSSIRLNPYGTIETIELGAFQLKASSEGHLSGVVIDYAVHRETAIATAMQYLEQWKFQQLNHLAVQQGRLFSAQPTLV